MDDIALIEADPGLAEPAVPVRLADGQWVILAAAVGRSFGVATREVNQAVARNPEKFSPAHSFLLSHGDVERLTSQAVISKPGRGGSRAPLRVFTQKGVARLATVLTSPQALQATDEIIDLFVEVYQQLATGSAQVSVANPSRLLPDPAAVRQVWSFRKKLVGAMQGLLGATFSTERKTTVRDELEEIGGGVANTIKEYLKASERDNDSIAADTAMILERVRDLRLRAAAGTRKSEGQTGTILLDNLNRKIDIVERMLAMADRMEPGAVATLYRGFAKTTQNTPGPEKLQFKRPSLA